MRSTSSISLKGACGWLCYLLGAGVAVFSLQLAVNCEILAAFGPSASNPLDLWPYLRQTSGQHSAYPHGYLLHWLRDGVLFVWGVLVIRRGRKQFGRVRTQTARPEKAERTAASLASPGPKTGPIWGLVSSWWLQLLIAFDENSTLRKTRKAFQLPADDARPDPLRRRQLTICNLFANQQQSIGDIARLLDISRGLVISTLIEQGLLKERRRREHMPMVPERRQANRSKGVEDPEADSPPRPRAENRKSA